MSGKVYSTTRKVKKFHNSECWTENDEIAVEYPLTIYVNNDEFATIICTPADLEEMTIGFLASEGVISSCENISQLLIDTNKGFAYVDLMHPSPLDPRLFSKRRMGSCCGKSRQSFYFYSDAKSTKKVHTTLTVTAQKCFQLMQKLHDISLSHHDTGGVHNAALCDTEQLLVTYTDIGRHNALDKIHGHCLKQSWTTHDKIIVFSGRISSEVVLKSAQIGAGILLSKSAPTDLALQLADELNLTTAGFLRGSRMNVYTYAERIIL